jgi:hypothetical protein
MQFLKRKLTRSEQLNLSFAITPSPSLRLRHRKQLLDDSVAQLAFRYGHIQEPADQQPVDGQPDDTRGGCVDPI